MIILIVIMNALLGLSFTLGKMLLGHAAPCFIVAVRMIAGGMVLTLYHMIRYRAPMFSSRSDVLICFQYAVFSLFAFPILRGWSLQSLPSSKAAVFFALFPLSTALAAFLLRGERLQMIQVFGLCLACFGLLPLLSRDVGSGLSFELGLPEMAIIGSVAMLSLGMVTLQGLVKDRGCHPVAANGLGMLMGGSLALLFSWMHEPIWMQGDLFQFVLLLVAQTLISNVICGVLQAKLLRRYSATIMSFASFLAPISSILYGVFLLRESVTWHIFASLGLIALSLVCYHAETISQHVSRPQRVS